MRNNRQLPQRIMANVQHIFFKTEQIYSYGNLRTALSAGEVQCVRINQRKKQRAEKQVTNSKETAITNNIA